MIILQTIAVIVAVIMTIAILVLFNIVKAYMDGIMSNNDKDDVL